MLDTLQDDETADAAAEASPEPPASSDPMAVECVAHRMLLDMRGATPANPFAYFEWEDPEVASDEAASDRVLSLRREAVGLLTKGRLASFIDESRTALKILNAGRYWALHGGYLGMLQQTQTPPAPALAKPATPPNQLRALNQTYMTWRIRTFWWSFGLSTASFFISITLLIIVLSRGGHY